MRHNIHTDWLLQLRGARLPLLAILALLLSACGMSPYQGTDVASASFLQRSITQDDGPIRVTAAVPDAGETLALTGLDLYEQGIQPIWMRVENNGPTRVRTALWSADRDYLSPIEVAYMNRKKFSSQGYADMERWFYENGMKRFIPPGESREGLVFTNLTPGTKGFNLDVFAGNESHNFTFFVPIPGFTADYTDIDFAHLYQPEDLRDMSMEELHTFLAEEFSCCATDPTGQLDATPLNVVLVGSARTLRGSLMRGDWQETEAGWREVEKLRPQYFMQRKADSVFYQSRADGDESIELRLWRSPWTVDSQQVWIGQAFYAIRDDTFWSELADAELFRDSEFAKTFIHESNSADLDSAQSFVLQNFWYSQSLAKMGMVGGIQQTSIANPGKSYTGLDYFTAGNRLVMFLSADPLALDEVDLIYNSNRPKDPIGADDD